MTPDVYVDLQIVNCMWSQLVQGAKADGTPSCHSYQMDSWFAGIGGPGSVVADIDASSTYRLRFLRGVGDEDDGADIDLSVGPSHDGSRGLLGVTGRSNGQSAHWFAVQIESPTTPGEGPFALGVILAGTWPTKTADAVTWYSGPQSIVLGAPNAPQCLLAVDLSKTFPNAAVADAVAQQIADRALTAENAHTLWIEILRRVG